MTQGSLMMPGRWMIVVGALAACLAVGAGAFGAHGLRARLAPEMLAVFETGVRYQFYHALALLACGVLAPHYGNGWLRAAAVLFVAGMLLFSGSLYALTLSGIRGLGAITPIGGVSWMVGWLCLAIAAARGGRP